MKKTKKSSVRKATGLKSKSAARKRTSRRRITRTSIPRSRLQEKSSRTLKLRKNSTPGRSKVQVEVPEILLEGDSPGAASLFKGKISPSKAVTEQAHLAHVATLPEAYGTQQLKLTPRDPHWIHAHWDFTRDQMRSANARSAEGHLVIKLFQGARSGPLVSETPVHRESVRWFVHAPEPAITYTAELGYYDARRQWSTLATSQPVSTPPTKPSAEHGFELATIGSTGSAERHATIKRFRVPPMPSLGGQLPGAKAPTSLQFSSGASLSPALGFGSFPDLAPASPGVGVWSSELGPSSFGVSQESASRFRLEVNAELIVHGATEPDATLKIAGRIIPLKPDGSFRLRFSLPDGNFSFPVEAISAKTGEPRAVSLTFERQTQTAAGPVGTATTEAGLNPPAVENL